MVLHQELGRSAIPDVHWKKAGEEGKLVVGSCRSAEQIGGYRGGASKVVQHGLNGLRVFHTFFCHRVTPLAERTWLMWEYSGLMDPDRASLEELPKDEVWSRLDRVLQLRDKDSLEGMPRPLHAMKLSNLVCSPLLIPCPFPSCSPLF